MDRWISGIIASVIAGLIIWWITTRLFGPSFSTQCQTAFGVCWQAPAPSGSECSCFNYGTGYWDRGITR